MVLLVSAKHVVTWNIPFLTLSHDFMSWWHFGFKCVRVSVLPMVGEISTLPALLPPNFTTFSSRRGLHPFVSSVNFRALLWRGLHPFKVEPNPTVLGRGVSTKAPWFVKRCSTISACQLAWFWLSVRTCRRWIDVLFDVQIFHDGSTKAFGVSLFPDLMDIHILFVLGYVCGSYMDCFVI